jgi:hypothetical protein
MRIDELDEYQGLTAEMVRNYLAATGWHLKAWDYYKDWHLAECAGPPCIAIYDSSHDGMYNLNPEHALLAISKHERRTSQAILREINPRMRKGMPSKEALAAHGHWLVRDTETGEIELHRVEAGHLYSVSHFRGNVMTACSKALPDFGQWMAFWPCDEHGAKVRWPEENGAML